MRIASKKIVVKLCAALLLLSSSCFADDGRDIPGHEKQSAVWANQAVSSDAAQARQGIQKLREAGPEGMNALIFGQRDAVSRALKLSPMQRAGNAKWKRLKFAFDKVGAQCDNWASNLYWFTDLEKAKVRAQKENKPILSLRLLGNLDEELSCANSRFFRTALYPNASINKYLRDTFVLHWQSVRPVPKVTIDFGDGRKIQSTITGNSIHYYLDPQGRVLDALPGLYGPGAFRGWLESCFVIDSDTRAKPAREDKLKAWHQQRLGAITAAWLSDARSLGFNVIGDNVTRAKLSDIYGTPHVPRPPANIQQTVNAQKSPSLGKGSTPSPTARQAGAVPVAKRTAEIGTLKAVTTPVPRDRNALQRTTSDELWEKIAALHEADARLDENSLKVLRAKTLNADKAAFNFQKSIAEDTVRNEYSRHTTIHQWLMENPNFELDALNKKVYAELFLTPDSDPWLGLLPEDAYTGIQNDGASH